MKTIVSLNRFEIQVDATVDAVHAKLLANLMAYIKSHPEGKTTPHIREYIFTISPHITDTQFNWAMDYLCTERFVVMGLNTSLTPMKTTLCHAVPNIYIQFVKITKTPITEGEADLYGIYRATLSDHYPTAYQAAVMLEVATDPKSRFLGARVIDLAFQQLKPTLSPTFFRTKTVLTEQLLIAKILRQLAKDREIVDYFTVKAYLADAIFIFHVDCKTIAEVGLMAHHYSVKRPRYQLPDFATIKQRLRVVSFLEAFEETSTA
jgi:hypothetical protein